MKRAYEKTYVTGFGGHMDLAAAIVRQAVADYIFLLHREDQLNRVLDAGHAAQRAHIKASRFALERFFGSDWCYALCGMERDAIMAEISERVYGRKDVLKPIQRNRA